MIFEAVSSGYLKGTLIIVSELAHYKHEALAIGSTVSAIDGKWGQENGGRKMGAGKWEAGKWEDGKLQDGKWEDGKWEDGKLQDGKLQAGEMAA